MFVDEWKLKLARGKLQDSPEKRDEVRAISVLAGMLLGSAFGMPLSIALGLIGSPGSGLPASEYIGNLIAYLSMFGFLILFGCIIAFVVCAYFWKKEEGKINLAHCALSSFTFFGICMYVLLLFTFLFNHFNEFLLRYLSPFSVFWYVALAFFPFVAISLYFFFPSLRPRIVHQLGLLATRKFWSDVRKNPKKHKKSLFLVTALVIIIVIDVLRALYA